MPVEGLAARRHRVVRVKAGKSKHCNPRPGGPLGRSEALVLFPVPGLPLRGCAALAILLHGKVPAGKRFAANDGRARAGLVRDRSPAHRARRSSLCRNGACRSRQLRVCGFAAGAIDGRQSAVCKGRGNEQCRLDVNLLHDTLLDRRRWTRASGAEQDIRNVRQAQLSQGALICQDGFPIG
jgi:hypothetical protein